VSDLTDQGVEKIDSLPTNEELGIEKIPVVAGSQRREPSSRAAKPSPFEGLIVSEMDRSGRLGHDT
jgi:hypothetical protein